MFPSFVSAASQPRVAPPSVDFHPHHEVVLLCSAARKRDASELAESLLALGFDALVLSGSLDELVDGLPNGAADDGPALLVPCDTDVDTPVLRSRVRRTFHREHLWLDGSAGSNALELQQQICARLDQLERERTQEVPIEPVDVDEVSNVILLPVDPTAPAEPQAARPVPSPATARKPAKYHYVLWPLVGATLTALGMAAVRPTEESAPAAAEVDVDRVAPPTTTQPEPSSPAKPATIASVPPPPPARVAAATPIPAAEESPEQEALTHDRVTATDDYLVFEAGEKARDWYAAMDVCRGRTHAGLEGWTTPSSRQLHALAKARVLPEAPLWSRTRSMREADVAFVVHGRAGTLRSSGKSETVSAAVCIRKRTEQQ